MRLNDWSIKHCINTMIMYERNESPRETCRHIVKYTQNKSHYFQVQ